MRTVAATVASSRLGAILDVAQREPILIRRDDCDVAVVLSMAAYDRLRTANVRAFVARRNESAAEAGGPELRDEKLVRARN